MSREVFLNKFTKGDVFENIIATKLLKAFNEPVHIFMSLRVKSPYLNKETEVDILLLTSFGVYCIEAKAMRSLLKGNLDDKMWIGKSGSYQTRLYNPVFQNGTHVRALKHGIRQLGMEPPPIKGVICIPNGCVIESNASNIYTIGSLFAMLETDSVTKERKWDITLLKEYFDKVQLLSN